MKIIFWVLLVMTTSTSAGELTDLLNGKFRIHNHNIRSISVKCDPNLGGKYRIISKLGYGMDIYSSAITCLDEKYQRQQFENDYQKPYEYLPYPLVYNFDFEPIGIRNKYLLSKIQIYPRRPSSWSHAPKVPYKNKNGDYIHQFIYELLDQTDFADNCNYQSMLDLNLKQCITYFDKELDYYPATHINKSRE